MKIKLLIIFSVFLLWTMVYGQWTAQAQVPRLINYQARLTDKEGQPLEGKHDITFLIYDVESAGAPLWEEVRNGYDVDKGIVSVMLGDVNSLGLAFDKEYYLQIKVDQEVMSPRQRITSAGYAIKAQSADTAAQAVNASTVAGYSVSNTAAANKIPIMGAKGYLPDNSVDTSALKTAVSEVSSTNRHTLTTFAGGEYGFYPQIKGSSAQHWAAAEMSTYPSVTNGILSTEYRTTILLLVPTGASTTYAKMKYITSSGEDYWIFLLIDKETKKIIAVSSAPDHPSYGNGGDYNEVAHPFSDYDESKHMIVLVEETQAKELQSQATEEVGVTQIINDNYKVDFSQKYKYVPLHSGKYIDEDGKQVKHLVETIPEDITVRKLVKLTIMEKRAREEEAEQKMKEYEQQKEQEEEKRQAAIAKLGALGLTEEDIRLLIEK